MERPKILILEDDMIIAMDISNHLSKMGYEVVDILARGEEAIQAIKEKPVDIMLVDINLKGAIDGIKTVQQIQMFNDKMGIVFLTANSDEVTFNRAKTTRPHAFISKPFKRLELSRAIELTILQIKKEVEKEISFDSTANLNEELDSYILDDRIFVKHRDQIVRIFIHDILYAEADRSYCKVYTIDKEYLMTFPLKTFETKLEAKDFLRIHRSYIINITKIDGITDERLTIGKRQLPIGPSFKKDLMKRLKLI